MTRPSEGISCQLAARAAGNKSIDVCMTVCNDKSGWRQRTTMQQPTSAGSSKGGWQLVSRLPGGIGWQLASKAASNKSVDDRIAAWDDKSGWQTTTQQPMNDRSYNGWVVAGFKTT